MSNNLPFTAQDILDAVMRAAFKPSSEFTGMQTDFNGDQVPMFAETPALIDPIIRMVKQWMEGDEEFQRLLRSAVLARIDEMAQTIVDKVASNNSAFGIARKEGAYRGHDSPPGYELADWLKAPLGEALATSLEPAIADHFAKDGALNLDNAKLDITVEVQPWPSKS